MGLLLVPRNSIVFDIGCNTYGEEESTHKLVERFDPEIYIGFDPLYAGPIYQKVRDTHCFFYKVVAWNKDGMTMFNFSSSTSNPVGAPIVTGQRSVKTYANCIDFSAVLLEAVGKFKEIIVKMDCEGSEIQLLDRLIEVQADIQISLLLIEWHDLILNAYTADERLRLTHKLLCPVELWEDHGE